MVKKGVKIICEEEKISINEKTDAGKLVILKLELMIKRYINQYTQGHTER